MDVVLLARVALPLLLLAFAGLLVVWPVVRLRRETGVWAITLHRETAPGQRVVAVVFLVLQLAVALLVAIYGARGPETLGVWPVPPWIVVSGLLWSVAGLVLIAVAQSQMGASFRIGIDDRKTALVEDGLFGVIRNPIFSGVLAILAGVVLVAPCIWSLLCWGAAAATVVRQTRLEEQHLLALHGDAYRTYARRVGRFFPGVGCLRERLP